MKSVLWLPGSIDIIFVYLLFPALPLIHLHDDPMHVFDSHILFRSFSGLQYKIIGFVPCHSLDRLCIIDSIRLRPHILLLLLDSFIVARWIILFLSFSLLCFVSAQRLDSMCMG